MHWCIKMISEILLKTDVKVEENKIHLLMPFVLIQVLVWEQSESISFGILQLFIWSHSACEGSSGFPSSCSPERFNIESLLSRRMAETSCQLPDHSPDHQAATWRAPSAAHFVFSGHLVPLVLFCNSSAGRRPPGNWGRCSGAKGFGLRSGIRAPNGTWDEPHNTVGILL